MQTIAVGVNSWKIWAGATIAPRDNTRHFISSVLFGYQGAAGVALEVLYFAQSNVIYLSLIIK